MGRACAVLVLTGCSFHFNATSPDDAAGDAARGATADAARDVPVKPPELVQQAVASADNTNSAVTATLAAPPAAGDLLVMIGGNSRGGLTTVSGGGVAHWTRATRSLANVNIELWYGISDGTSAAVAIACPASNDPIWELVTEWSGMASASVLDAASSAAGTSSPASAGDTPVTTGELALFAVADLTPTTFGTPAPVSWTALMPASTSTTIQQAWYAVAASTGTLAPTVSETAHSWDAAIASFHAH